MNSYDKSMSYCEMSTEEGNSDYAKINDIIKKLAEKHVEKIAKAEKFNLKTAQQN